MNYNKIYHKIIETRRNHIIDGYNETHHIIPRCLGGSNDISNLVVLSAREHFICHLLLTKMYPKGSIEYYKMCHAFMMMLIGTKNNQRYITSRKFEVLRIGAAKNISNIMKFVQKGSNNSQYGTMWIHNLELKECKKVPKNSIIEEGWTKGRVLNWNKIIKLKICKKCGELNCLTDDICSRHQLTNTFIKYFNFDKTTIGTKNFVKEFNRIIEILNYEYNVNMLSIENIKKKYNLTSNERTRSMLKTLNIERRNLSDAVKNYRAEV